jgi:hypothetical protein
MTNDKLWGMGALVVICGIAAWALGVECKDVLLTCAGAIGGLISGAALK